MSFVRLDNGEFPPLSGQTQNQKVPKSSHQKQNKFKVIQVDNWTSSNRMGSQYDYDNIHHYTSKDQMIEKQRKSSASSENSSQSWSDGYTGSSFLRCRVGIQSVDFANNLESVLDEFKIGHFGDFLLTPMEPIRRTFYDSDIQPISDLALPSEIWESRIALSLGHPPIDCYDQYSRKHFEKLFKHALYLLSPVLVINCPDSNLALLSIASTVNDYLASKTCGPVILFKTQAEANGSNSRISWSKPSKQKDRLTDEFFDQSNRSTKLTIKDQVIHDHEQSEQKVKQTYPQEYPSNEQIRDMATNFKSQLVIDIDGNNFNSESTSQSDETGFEDKSTSNVDVENRKKQLKLSSANNKSAWTLWNNIRSHLVCHRKVGVCLELSDNFFEESDDGIDVWLGEQVRMIIVHVDQFTRSSEDYSLSTLKLNNKCKNFIEKILLANSLNTSIVIQGNHKSEDLKEYIIYLDCFTNDLVKKHQSALLDWNDSLQCPLQPLSSNLDSGTYSVFESDSMKYTRYREAMVEAINVLLEREKQRKRFNIMVLGAGRGPLVDRFIEALESIKQISNNIKFKIFALDKNPSSIHSLRYKQSLYWNSKNGLYETEVVEADMRDWRPGVKADIIITELLGSFSDNELSPECIDGTWKLASPNTISIPQEYSSYIGPICSHKIYSKLSQSSNSFNHVFDQIYVVRLANFYGISEPQKLFRFDHSGNLNLPPTSRCNERYERLVFWSSTDTVCHGFGGYFMAKLFGSTTISTVHTNKTPGMESWFPVFIPLDTPIQMPKNTKLELHFWRKESSTSVWYEWAVTEPIRSRIYSPKGVSTAMSKFI